MTRAAKAPVTTQGPQRLRPAQLKLWVTPELRDRLRTLADAEGDTIAEWLERQVERCELEAEMRGTVGTVGTKRKSPEAG